MTDSKRNVPQKKVSPKNPSAEAVEATSAKKSTGAKQASRVDLPPTEFATLPLSADLVAVVQEMGFQKLSPIQRQSIPLLLQGKDLIGQSKTGSGKTAAFALPILQKLALASPHLQALILCPTRELCAQVTRDIRKLGRKHPGLKVLPLAGGTPVRPQRDSLENGIHIAVGTPGRILDHINREHLDLSKLVTVVLDEADRMLDMGFEEDMALILKATPKSRQTVFFSATFPEEIEAMSRTYQRHPARITISEKTEAAGAIRQLVYTTTNETKSSTLVALLQEYQPESAIVFCNTKIACNELVEILSNAKVSTACLHGELEQYMRDRVMARFRNKSVRVLIATDVAARGIDVENLEIVFNFDLPSKPDVYVHRIGRTGRAGKAGLAISLATQRDLIKIQGIEAVTRSPLEKKSLSRFSSQKEQSPKAVFSQDAKMETLLIAGGRKDKVRPGDILGALTGEAGGLKASDIGKIEIHDNFSYVAVSAGVAKLALQRLNNGKIKGRKFRVEIVR